VVLQVSFGRRYTPLRGPLRGPCAGLARAVLKAVRVIRLIGPKGFHALIELIPPPVELL
jgi:hypothetical protein